MTEKRFMTDYGVGVLDTLTNEIVCDCQGNQGAEQVVDLLNEQQTTINKLKSDIEETEISIKLFEDDIATKDKKINEQQTTITELKSIINFASNEGDLIVLLMKEIIKLRQEVQECQAYETIEKGVSL